MSTQQLKIHNHQCEHCGMRYKCDNRYGCSDRFTCGICPTCSKNIGIYVNASVNKYIPFHS
jgi:hypothetical protein